MDNRSENRKWPLKDPRPAARRQAYSELLADHAAARRRGSSVLSTDGIRHIRQLIRTATRLPAGHPRWDADQGHLWLGAEPLYEFHKAAPAVTPFLDAFEAAGWTTDSLPVPVRPEPRESDAEFRVRVETTVKNLNRMVKGPNRKPGQPMLHFRLSRDRKRVRWELVLGKGRGSGRRR